MKSQTDNTENNYSAKATYGFLGVTGSDPVTTTDLGTEDRMLAACHQWAWNTYPSTRRCLFHIPNEMDRLPGESTRNHIRRLSQAKAKGVVPGVPDLVLIWKGKAWGFELKTSTGTVSPAQREVHAAWAQQGIVVDVIRSLEQFQYRFIQIITE